MPADRTNAPNTFALGRRGFLGAAAALGGTAALAPMAAAAPLDKPVTAGKAAANATLPPASSPW